MMNVDTGVANVLVSLYVCRYDVCMQVRLSVCIYVYMHVCMYA